MTSSSFDANSSGNYFDAIANLDIVVETARGPAVLLSCITPFTLIWLQTIAAGNALSLDSLAGFQGVCTGQQLPTPKLNPRRRTRNCDPCGTCSEGKVKVSRHYQSRARRNCYSDLSAVRKISREARHVPKMSQQRLAQMPAPQAMEKETTTH